MKRETIKIKSIEEAPGLSAYGSSSMGYLEHRGVKIRLSDDTIISGYFGYSSKAYGVFHNNNNNNNKNIRCLNGHFLNKYLQYEERVRRHFNNILYVINSNKKKKEFKNVREVITYLKGFRG